MIRRLTQCHRDGGDVVTRSQLQSATCSRSPRCSNLILMSFPSSEIGAKIGHAHTVLPRQSVQKSQEILFQGTHGEPLSSCGAEANSVAGH